LMVAENFATWFPSALLLFWMVQSLLWLVLFLLSPSDCDMTNNSKLCAKEWSHWCAHYGCLAGSQYGADGFLFSFFGRAKWMYTYCLCFYFFRNYLK
jgi:hypothetical protein